MRDESLLKLSFVASVVGITMLFFTVQLMGAKEVKISEISRNLVGSNVVIHGIVAYKYEKNGNTFLKVSDNSSKIDVVAFRKPLDVKKGEYVKVYGKVKIYKNRLEIVAENVTVL